MAEQPKPVFKIAIIGAGIAGCTLARLLLHQSAISTTIFEGELFIDVRTQGGTLDLRENSGLKAIHAMGLYPEFLKHARYDGESLRITDKKLFNWASVGGRSNDGKPKRGGRPEIDRKELRKMLIQSLPDGIIRWGKRLQTVDKDLSLHFGDSIERGFDLIVGADGAWSKVRPLLSSVKPQYFGVSGAQFSIADIAGRHPDLAKLINRGSIFSISDHKEVIAQQMGDGSLSCAYFKTVPDERWIDTQNKDDFQVDSLKELSDWAPELRKLIEVADVDSIWYRNIYNLPTGHHWTPKQGLTLIGDAAHLTTPFAGLGANIAMQDAMKLADTITTATKLGGDDGALFAQVTQFETDMFKRAMKVQEISVKNGEDRLFAEDSPRMTIAGFISRAVESEVGPVAGALLKPVIHLYYWVMRLYY